MTDEHIRGKGVEEILTEMVGTALPNSEVHEQQKMAVFARSIAGLSEAIRDDTRSTDRLERRIWWLNVVLAVATVVGALAALVSAF
jgi:hypothetical protein